MIDKIVFSLSDKFNQFDWDVYFDEGIGKYCIFVNDCDFYFNSKKFRNWLKILRKKYPKTKFFCAFKNFKH